MLEQSGCGEHGGLQLQSFVVPLGTHCTLVLYVG
jgi:hypothetical protein